MPFRPVQPSHRSHWAGDLCAGRTFPGPRDDAPPAHRWRDDRPRRSRPHRQRNVPALARLGRSSAQQLRHRRDRSTIGFCAGRSASRRSGCLASHRSIGDSSGAGRDRPLVAHRRHSCSGLRIAGRLDFRRRDGGCRRTSRSRRRAGRDRPHRDPDRGGDHGGRRRCDGLGSAPKTGSRITGTGKRSCASEPSSILDQHREPPRFTQRRERVVNKEGNPQP